MANHSANPVAIIVLAFRFPPFLCVLEALPELWLLMLLSSNIGN